jgi:hypothetical protein
MKRIYELIMEEHLEKAQKIAAQAAAARATE